ncbi:DnaJ family domain-containing protein [Sporosarcina gallistercoris]|uniref:DUF1992 domain-containing protein n=1 Tax=Sporosarcina gallistercoris TaxID=2762245 RepID=A0ABR8PK02_9BACL|nr:DnaJ family domain-containing protein [Sporosarcina gallistercoris]MBD7908467.1 DUF1992 domain-containing protein [Sporosarcina gallistercoris]
MRERNEEQPYNDLMGDILKKHREEGGMDNLKGRGKPLSREYFSGDTLQHFQRIAKEAGYKPHWIELQDEIREDVRLLAEYLSAGIVVDMDEHFGDINLKLAKYNRACPRPMQKGPITLATVYQAVERITLQGEQMDQEAENS